MSSVKEIPLQNKTLSYRLLEILPAALTWGSFLLIILLSLYNPIFISTLILLYLIYWFAKSIMMSIHLVMSFLSYKKAIAYDWLKLLNTDPDTKDEWKKLWQVVIIANAKEDAEILEATCEAIAKSHYALDRIIVVLANEARFPEVAKTNMAALRKRFNGVFGGLYNTLHPVGLPNEVVGKGANITYSLTSLLPELKKIGVDSTNTLVTTLDSDNRVHPSFFADLAWTYLKEPDRDHKSYQPLPIFMNNIWMVPYVIRFISIGSSFWQMIEATRPNRLRNFSAHSQSLALLEKTKFWSTRTIVEDGHQYWRSFFATGGKHSVVPIFVPIYQDAVLSPHGHLMTYREQYLQKRRWAYGASDVPYVLTNLWKDRKNLPLSGWWQAMVLIEGHYSWAATSLVLAFFSWLPTTLNHQFQSTVLAYNFGLLYHRILTLALLGTVVTLVISRLLLPPRPKTKLHSNDFVEWALTPFLLPLANVTFGSFAAIDAQTRLAIGKYLGFRVTEKAVARQALPVT